ncbi:MAG: VOC family protein [Pigmentiphaga sp.]|nr:VOC family protein [Pigmentiphaga sp.]
MKIEPYLFFDGQAEEAMAFYEQALEAKIEATMRYADCPEPIPAEYLPPGGPQKVLHGSLLVHGQRLMFCDGTPNESGHFRGFSLTLQYATEEEVRRVFNNLAEGGNVLMPLDATFFSPCFGQVADRFGVRWMVMLDHPAQPLS